MKTTPLLFAGLVAPLLLSAQPAHSPQLPTLPLGHDRTRPLPPVVVPGHPGTPDMPGKPPSDAVIQRQWFFQVAG